MNSKVKLHVILGFILLNTYAWFVVSGKLYQCAEWIEGITGYNRKILFLVLGIMSMLLVGGYTVFLLRMILHCIFPREASKSSKTYSTFKEAKSNCTWMCVQCGENCCPLLKK